MKKLLVLFAVFLVLVPSMSFARLNANQGGWRGDGRRHEHRGGENRRQNNKKHSYEHHRSSRGGGIVGGFIRDVLTATTVIVVGGVVIGVASAIERSAQNGQCYRDVTPGYTDGYGRFISTGPTQRTQVSCR